MASSLTEPAGPRVAGTGRHVRRGPGARGLALTAGVAAAAYAVLTVVVALDPAPLAAVDGAVVETTFGWTRAHPALERLALLDDWWQQPFHVELGVLLLAVAAAVARRTALAVWLLLTSAAQASLDVAAKWVLDRPRPAWDDPVTTLDSASFPSGHAAAAGMLLAVVVLASWTWRRWWRRLLVGLAALVVVLACLDRLLLGVHYPSDLLGGVLLGVATASTAALLVRRMAGPLA